MHNTLTLCKPLFVIGIPLILFGVLIGLMESSLLQVSDSFAIAITTDLLLTIPLIYFLLIRKTAIPNTTTIPVMVLGLILGSYYLPQEHQQYLSLFKNWILPLLEICVFTFVIFKVNHSIKNYRQIKGTTPDFFSAVKQTCAKIAPQKLSILLATEIAVFYYIFFSWKQLKLKSNQFSYHKNSGTPALMIAFLFIIVIETVALHLLLEKWNMLIAWILTILSVYSVFQVLGMAKSLSKRPIEIEKHHIKFRYGIMNEVSIPISEIESITQTMKTPQNEAFKTLSPLGELESHNIVIRLKHPQAMTGLYGIKSTFKTLLLHIDEPNKFKDMAEA